MTIDWNLAAMLSLLFGGAGGTAWFARWVYKYRRFEHVPADMTAEEHRVFASTPSE